MPLKGIEREVHTRIRRDRCARLFTSSSFEGRAVNGLRGPMLRCLYISSKSWKARRQCGSLKNSHVSFIICLLYRDVKIYWLPFQLGSSFVKCAYIAISLYNIIRVFLFLSRLFEMNGTNLRCLVNTLSNITAMRFYLINNIIIRLCHLQH